MSNNTIFHYPATRPIEKDDNDDLNINDFKPAEDGAIFFSQRLYYSIIVKKGVRENLYKILKEDEGENEEEKI